MRDKVANRIGIEWKYFTSIVNVKLRENGVCSEKQKSKQLSKEHHA